MAFVDNEKREEAFQLQQTNLRAHIRVGEGAHEAHDYTHAAVHLLRLMAEHTYCCRKPHTARGWSVP